MRNKLVLQIIICVGFSFFAVYGQKTENTIVSNYYEFCQKAVMHQTTADEVEAVWNQMTNAVHGAPSKIVSAVTSVNEASKYGQPIDEESSGAIRQVHAVAGGVVTKTGFNSEHGLYVELKHEGAISIYGNLSTVGVVEKERIQRGEIIGSFDSSKEKEFYYDLRTDL